jgi:hypothetical protein
MMIRIRHGWSDSPFCGTGSLPDIETGTNNEASLAHIREQLDTSDRMASARCLLALVILLPSLG